MIELVGVKKHYGQGEGQVCIFESLDLNISKPGSYAIMGRSGCGKSTLIGLISGIIAPTQGQVKLLGKDLAQLSVSALNEFRAHSLGVIFQQFHLLDHFTALENTALPLFLRKDSQPLAKAQKALERVGLGKRLHHRPEQLSRGECQRVGIARVMVMEPKIVLADEPTGSLDTQTGEQIMKLLLEIVAEKQVPLVFVTHDNSLAKQCDSVYRLEEGRLL